MLLARRLLITGVALMVVAGAQANPIPWPLPAKMPLEDMYSELFEYDCPGGLREFYTGDYYFSYIPKDLECMKYPLPPDAEQVEVLGAKLPDDWEFNGWMLPYIHELMPPLEPLPWNYIWEEYPTVLPEWPLIPMIEWRNFGMPFPPKAMFRVKYAHNLLRRGNDLVYFYALGTGKYYQTYQKEAISFLDITMPSSFNMYRLFLDTTPHPFAVTCENGKTVISIYATAEYGPFDRDIIGIIRPWLVAADVNYDGATNILDLIKVRNSLGVSPATDAAADDADVNGDGVVNVLDLIRIRNHMGEAADTTAALPPQITLRYKVKPCGSTWPPMQPPQVVASGRNMLVSDDIIFNCCVEYVRMTILVNGNHVLFREKAMESAPCDCICRFPMRGTAGPFAPGTYWVQMMNPSGQIILDKTVVIPDPAVTAPAAD